MNRKIVLFLSSTALGMSIGLDSHGAPGYGPSGTVPAVPGGGQYFYPAPALPPIQPIGAFMAPRPQAGGLYPSYTYSQQPTQSPQQQQSDASASQTQASLLVANWMKNKDKYNNINLRNTSFDKVYQTLDDARGNLLSARQYLTPDKRNDADRVLWVLKFIKLKVMLQELNVLKTNMPFLLNDVVQNNNPDQTRRIPGLGKDPIGRDWIKDKQTALLQIMTDMKTKLFSAPNFVNNIPPQLEGINVTYKKAIEMNNYLTQQLGCFTNLDPNLCPFKAGGGKQQGDRQDSLGGFGYSNREYDDDGYSRDFEDRGGGYEEN